LDVPRNESKVSKAEEKGVNKTQPKRVMDSSIKEKLLSLIRYYRECVQIEDLSDIRIYSSEENKIFIQCPQEQEWLSSGKESYEINSDSIDFKEFGAKLKYRSRQVSYYYAYPIYIEKFFLRDSRQPSFRVLPFFIFPVEVEKTQQKISIKRSESIKPQINTSILDVRGVARKPEQKRDFVQSLLERWNDEEDVEANLKQAIALISEEFGKDVVMDSQLETLTSRRVDIQNTESGFYATGVFFVTQGSDFTFGLEEELNDLERILNDGGMSAPVIEAIISREKQPFVNPNDNKFELIEVTQLNDEQRDAVKSAFNNTLSVITGPPGTGKSQVVINIIANAVARGENVLFGSKNHKAVDVVIDRIASKQKEPIILKFGQNSKDSLFVERLLGSVDKALSENENALIETEKDYDETLKKLTEEEQNIWNRVQKCYEARNEIDHIDLLVSSLENNLPSNLLSLINGSPVANCSPSQFSKLKSYAAQLETGKLNFFSKVCNLIGLNLLKSTKRLVRRITEEKSFAQPLKNYFFEMLVDNSQVVTAAKYLIDMASLWDLRAKCTNLRKGEFADAEKLTQYSDKLNKIRENKLVISPKYIDVLMLKKFKKLGQNTRKDISDYEATLRRIESDKIGGKVPKELRKQKEELFGSVAKSFPAIAVTNLSVRHAAPLQGEIVDLVVIDEASQCDIASAIPLLARAKRGVIIGDEKQLIHVSNLRKDTDQQVQDKYDLKEASDQRFIYSTQSLFDLCKTTVGTSGEYFYLRDHFRSRAEIIEFSNKVFYNGALRVWTDYRQLRETGMVEGVIWHDVKGKVKRPSSGKVFNLEEAARVVELLKSILPKAIKKGSSIGIVTPFAEQENKIRDLLGSIPMQQLDAVDFLVDTAHGFQGDERDIVIFSPVVAEGLADPTKGFLRNTQNLFNVAITRPRAELHIVGDRSACAKSGIKYLEQFTEYISGIQRMHIYARDKYGALFDSPWEELFFKKLKERGIKTTPQLAIHQYKLDLAIEDHCPPIDIEIDGELYHRTITGERCVSDVKRDIRLSMLGWIVKRFWVYQLKYDLDNCLKQIEDLVKSNPAS
jgi:superfamily I DNA and/or RNA helicase